MALALPHMAVQGVQGAKGEGISMELLLPFPSGSALTAVYISRMFSGVIHLPFPSRVWVNT